MVLHQKRERKRAKKEKKKPKPLKNLSCIFTTHTHTQTDKRKVKKNSKFFYTRNKDKLPIHPKSNKQIAFGILNTYRILAALKTTRPGSTHKFAFVFHSIKIFSDHCVRM